MGIAKPASAFILATGLFAAFPASSSAAFNYFDPDSISKVPATLAATGFYDNIATKQVTARAVPFEVNSALWSDAAGKKRWVLVKQGRSITYKDTTDYYTYPDSTVFIKEFAHDTVPGDTTTRILWETRLLVLKKDTATKMDVWHGFSYRWNRQGTDARLVNLFDGEKAALRYYPNGRNQPAQLKKWTFPSQGACNTCHVNGNGQHQGRGVLGFFTAQINKTVNGQNQLTRLFDAGVFTNITPRPNFGNAPRWAALNDNSASLELRARSYLGANCSGCHSYKGYKIGALGHGCKVNFDYFDIRKPETFHDTLRHGALEYQGTSQGNPMTADSNYIIHPKHPHLSSVIWRLQAKNDVLAPADTTQWAFSEAFDTPPAVMPPLGRYESDTLAIRVISEWINTLPEKPMSVFHGIRTKSASKLRIAGNLIHVEGLKDIPAKAWLVDTRGVSRAVTAVGPGRYRLPEGVAPGVYHLVLGADRSFRILLP